MQLIHTIFILKGNPQLHMHGDLNILVQPDPEKFEVGQISSCDQLSGSWKADNYAVHDNSIKK